MTDGGDGAAGRLVSSETKNKMSTAKSGEKHPMYGKQHTQETKRKQSLIRIGKYCGKNNAFYGKKHNKETKNKMSAIRKGNIPVNKGKSYKFITNGIDNTQISFDVPIPQGWYRGLTRKNKNE